jgi:hypothetical protein
MFERLDQKNLLIAEIETVLVSTHRGEGPLIFVFIQFFWF